MPRAKLKWGMDTIDGRLLDARIGHLIGLTRIDNGIAREILELLTKRHGILVAKVRSSLNGQTPDLQRLLAELAVLNKDTYEQLYGGLADRLDVLRKYEAEYTEKMLRANIPSEVLDKLNFALPPVELLEGIASKPFQGKLLKTWMQQQAAGTLDAVRTAIQLGMIAGEGAEKITRRLMGGVIDGTPVVGLLQVKRYQARALVRTAVMHTVSETTDAIYEANVDLIPAVRWLSTLDFSTTSFCVVRDGLLYDTITKEPIGHSYPWGGGPGRFHFQCVPAGTRVLPGGRTMGVYSRWHEGEMITVETASGRVLSATPNHPILTPDGWVSAAKLDVGDHVICDARPVWGVVDGEVDTESIPPKIEDVVEAALASSAMCSVEVPTTSEDFHGDGLEGEVAVVGSERLLGNRLIPSAFQLAIQKVLRLRNLRMGEADRLASSGVLASVLPTLRNTAHRIMGRLRLFLAFFGRGSFHPRGLLLASVSEGNPGFFQDSFDRPFRASETFANAGHTNAAVEQGNDFIERQIDRSPTTALGFESSSFEHSDDRGRTDAELASYLASGAEIPVFQDHIVRRDVSYRCCHVYNLETEQLWFSAQSILTHNCRSDKAPVTGLDDVSEGQRSALGGAVPKQTAEEWLKKQPEEKLGKMFGKERARLFKQGRLGFRDLVDDNGSYLSLDDLAKLEGIEPRAAARLRSLGTARGVRVTAPRAVGGVASATGRPSLTGGVVRSRMLEDIDSRTRAYNEKSKLFDRRLDSARDDLDAIEVDFDKRIALIKKNDPGNWSHSDALAALQAETSKRENAVWETIHAIQKDRGELGNVARESLDALLARDEKLKWDYRLAPAVKNDPKRRGGIRRGMDWLRGVWRGELPDEALEFRGSRKRRATHHPFGVDTSGKNPLSRSGWIGLPKRYGTWDDVERVTVHEVGHWLEGSSHELHDTIVAFLEKRTKGETALRFGKGYWSWERYKPDKFIERYMGSWRDSGNGIRSSEILSMGLEFLWKDPARLAREDPEFFDFIVDLVLKNNW